MNLRQMEVFRAVMLAGGVSGAAELLHVSQPAVSKLLAQCARQLGFPLFARVKGRLVPTPEAQELHAEIDALWRGVQRVHDVSKSLASPRGGTLSLGVSASFAPYLVPRALALLAEQFPDLQTRMEILVTPILIEALQTRAIDIGVALLPIEHPNLVRVQSHECGFAFVAPPRHKLAKKRIVTPADLADQRVIGSPPDTPYGQALLRAYGKEGASLKVHFQVRSATSACWQAQAGGGVAVVDRAAVAGPAFTRLAVRPFQTRERLPLAVLRNRFRPPSVVQEAFCEAFDAVWKQEMRG
ncbi:LysR substrate-binding domain-containing protein [Ramlibacter sp. XY19]|uniref:LysR family transcriptional regulator n=1 Tax=Ramlibacter paludis TaxID=2908000 RepID=UPI0023DA1115|nr:LysR substrate-binding domain-containing protein [Ramlibacter paludis]MCG2591349.1 LysR substrate-binding domain-containing protein [Ramlibacter paludis]